jgi:hypothetical protein
MADEASPAERLSPDERARLRTTAVLLEAAQTPDALRLAAAELARLAELGEAGATLPAPPTVDIHLHLVSEEELARSGVEYDAEVEAKAQAARDRLGPDALARLIEVEPVILRRVADDPDWAVEFALRPLSALRRLEPRLAPDLLAALERAGGGPDEAFRGFGGRIRVVEAGGGDGLDSRREPT